MDMSRNPYCSIGTILFSSFAIVDLNRFHQAERDNVPSETGISHRFQSVLHLFFGNRHAEELTHTARKVNRAAVLMVPGNPSCSESGIRFRQSGEKAAHPVSLQNPGFASRTRRGISTSSDSLAA